MRKKRRLSQDIVLVNIKEKVFRWLLMGMSVFTVLIVFTIFVTLLLNSLLSIQAFGIGFFVNTVWDPVRQEFGSLPFFVGTLITGILALIISIPFSMGLSLYVGEYLKKGIISNVLSVTLDILAGIPSVVYGFWGIFVLISVVRNFEMAIGVIPYGVGIFAAALILSLMITPYSASISREVISLVPHDLKEAALSLGATQYEMVRYVILPNAKSGIFAGVLMSFGRAISETMAVTMVIGNSNRLPLSIFSPGNTLSSVIANEFAEASEELYLSSLMELALVLFVVTTIFSIIGRFIIRKWTI